MKLTLLFLVILSSVHCDTCDEENCQDTISMPLLDNMRASLKADLDTSQMNKHLKSYIQQEITKGVQKEIKGIMMAMERNITKNIYGELQQNLTDLYKRQPPSFFATLTDKLTPALNQIIVFDNVITNIGGGYSSSTGIFTVPQSGLYMISATIRAWAGKTLHCELRINNVRFTAMFGKDWTQGTANIVVQLNTGDKVTVVKNNSYDEIVSSDRWAMFSGFLIA